MRFFVFLDGDKRERIVDKVGAAINKLKEIVAAEGGALDLFQKETREGIYAQRASVVRAEKDARPLGLRDRDVTSVIAKRKTRCPSHSADYLFQLPRSGRVTDALP